MTKQQNRSISFFRTAWRSTFSKLAHLGLLVVLAWGIFFVAYLAKIQKIQENINLNDSAEAIFILTGDKGRIKAGIQIFEQKRAEMIFITGVGDHTHKDNILPAAIHQAASISPLAKNTKENFDDIEQWVKQKNIVTAFLVTSDYHMPRALDIAKRRTLKTTLIPAPVKTIFFEQIKQHPQQSAKKIWKIVNEFNKYMYQQLTGLMEL